METFYLFGDNRQIRGTDNQLQLPSVIGETFCSYPSKYITLNFGRWSCTISPMYTHLACLRVLWTLIMLNINFGTWPIVWSKISFTYCWLGTDLVSIFIMSGAMSPIIGAYTFTAFLSNRFFGSGIHFITKDLPDRGFLLIAWYIEIKQADM